MRLLVAALMFVASLLVTQAQASDPINVRLLNGGYSANTETALLGIEVAMPDGWHTYWKTAGEGGFPPELDTSGSFNIRSFDLAWPAPEKIETLSALGQPALQTNGYMVRALFPILVKPADPKKDVKVKLSLRLYACKDYCVAFERQLETTIQQSSKSAYDQRKIGEWLRKVPRASSEALSISSPKALSNGKLSVIVTSAFPMTKPWLHVANSDNMPYTMELKALNPNSAEFTIGPQDGSFGNSQTLEFVATSGSYAVTETYDRPVLSTPFSWSMVITAFIGGLILNVMPCVFPVLSLKLMALTSGNSTAARIGFASSALGIVGSFVFLGTALAVMKVAGAEIGWGIQFQSPVFLAVMAIITLVFAFGTAGFFEIALPTTVATKATRWTDGHGFAASLTQGFVATLLATPCSAPFVGTAVGFALGGGFLSILGVFSAMGLGMALPYVLIALTPGLSKFLPRPGLWMQRVKQSLSIGLFATAGWLCFTLASVWYDAVAVIALLFSIGVVVGVVGGRIIHGKGRYGLVILAATAFAAPGIVDRLPSRDRESVAWQSFRPDAIRELVGQGKTVLVYVTADWCITCKVNDRTTWSSSSTIDVVNALTVPMKADWTKPDSAISAFLKSKGRYGIPFTVIYAPGNADGILLPEILTPETVEKALKR
jgi:suppressor for copper-sensitivity B